MSATREEIEAAVERFENSDGFACSFIAECEGELFILASAFVNARATRKAAIERATKEISHLLAMGCELSQITIEGIITRELEGDGNA